jgi:hypothetical protein
LQQTAIGKTSQLLSGLKELNVKNVLENSVRGFIEFAETAQS